MGLYGHVWAEEGIYGAKKGIYGAERDPWDVQGIYGAEERIYGAQCGGGDMARRPPPPTGIHHLVGTLVTSPMTKGTLCSGTATRPPLLPPQPPTSPTAPCWVGCTNVPTHTES